VAASPTAEADPSTLEPQVQESSKEVDLILEQLHLVQEEMEMDLQRCEVLEAHLQAAPRAA